MRKNIFVLIILLIILLGCTKTVDEITSDDSYLNKKVSVKGEVNSPLKIGPLSGYTLVDKNGDKIIVGSERLPAEGDTVTAKGILKKGPLGIGFYIDTNPG